MKSITSKTIWILILIILLMVLSLKRTGHTLPDKQDQILLLSTPSTANNDSYYLPYPAGTSLEVTGDGSTHQGQNRHAIDFRTGDQPNNKVAVLAMRSGWLTQYWDIDAGHYIAIEHSDGMCSHYYHLSVSSQ